MLYFFLLNVNKAFKVLIPGLLLIMCGLSTSLLLMKNSKFFKSLLSTLLTENSISFPFFKNLIIKPNRTDGIKEAVKTNHDCVILDDGFQDYSLKKNINIICFRYKNRLERRIIRISF